MTTHQIHMAFVTGGSGFVGRNLIAALQARGIQVRALARSKVARETVQQAGAEPSEGDLSDPDALRRSMLGCDTVFHVAGKVGDWGHFEEFYQTNVVGTEHVLAAAQEASVSRLVHVSTEAVLLDGKPPRDAQRDFLSEQ